jgi:NAD(P)-dependent dehydrogenase (short-subunit alcohol dehydrogenase family)
MMGDIVAHSGSLHALVNNASSFEPDAAESMDVDGARSQLEVNLVAPLALSSLMVQDQIALTGSDDKRGTLCILHILDQKVFNLNPDYFSYTVTKLALERAVALQAQALAPDVRVCGVAPGLMYVSGPQSIENFERASRVNLMRKPTDPVQVAASCLFLAQNPCITGVTLTVDNGQHLVPLPRDVMFVVDELMKDRDGR